MSTPSRMIAVAGLLATLLVVAIGLVLRQEDDAAPVAPTRTTAPSARSANMSVRPSLPAASDATASDSLAARLPPSLRDTEIDGWLGVDDDGHLVVTPGARWFFDYFLSATGEESDDDIRARIVAEIERRLPPAGTQEAVALLDRYLAYRERVHAEQAGGAAEDLERRLAALHQIRVEIFGASDAAILFGEEEQVQAADLRRRAVMGDPTLDAGERERRLHEIEQQLPAAIRAARADTFAPLQLRQDEQALRAAGGTADDIRALREQRFGAEAADRLAALDREQAAWRQRVDDYRHARQVIEADATLSQAARAQALEALIAQRFTEQERLRVEALERQ